MPLERIDTVKYSWIEKGVVDEHMSRYVYACDFLKGDNILDIACGTGYGTAILSKKAKGVRGADISQDAVDTAKSRNPDTNYLQLDATQIALPDASLDTVVSFETIEHVPPGTVEKTLSEFARVLKPGGRLIISTPDKRSYSLDGPTGNPFHTIEYTLDEFNKLLGVHFNIESIAGQKFSWGLTVGFAKCLGSFGLHGIVSKFWRGYKMVICRNAKVIPMSDVPGQIPLLLVYVCNKK